MCASSCGGAASSARNAPEPLSDDVIRQHRAVAVADSIQRGAGLTVGLLAGQDVFTVTGMPAKLDAQLRGLGAGFLPTCLAQPYIDTGRLVVKRVERPEQQIQVSYAWRKSARPGQGRALQWWLTQLQSPPRARRSWASAMLRPSIRELGLAVLGLIRRKCRRAASVRRSKARTLLNAIATVPVWR